MSTPPRPLTIERIRNLVDELRSAYTDLLGGDSIAAPALIRSIVAEWSSEVLPTIDARIMKCHELIKRGLRDEAIGYASDPPDLLEAIKQLDLERFGPEYAQWVEASHVTGLLMPQAPQLDKAGDIEAARERLAELRPLLEQWRRLNIQRAPLPTRIRMLLDLLQRDPTNPAWQEMLAEHEKHRLMQIRAGIARLQEKCARGPHGDIAGVESEIDRFLSELKSEWRTLQPPGGLADQVTLLGVELRQRRIDATLDGLVGLLTTTYERLDTDRSAAKAQLGRHVDAWNAALADRGVIAPADPRLAHVAPIVEYVSRFREMESLAAEIVQRLDERPTSLRKRLSWSVELDRMMDRIDDAASRLPGADVDAGRINNLSDRVARAAESVQREVFWWQLVRGAAVAAVAVVLTAGAWAIYSARRHVEGVQAAVNECASALSAIEAGAAADSGLGNGWTEAIRRNPAVTEAMDRVAAARQAHEDRRASLAARLDEIRVALGQLQTTERPDPLAPWPEAFVRAAQLLADVRDRKLARVDEELAKLEQPAAALRTKAKEFGDAADDAFDDRVRRLEAELAVAEIALSNDPGGAESVITAAVAELDGLRLIAGKPACPAAGEGYGQRKLVSNTVSARVAPDAKLPAALNALRVRRTMMAGLAEREARATRLLDAGKYAEYADAIREIAKDVGRGPAALDYPAVADKHPVWQAVSEWMRFVADLGDPSRFTSEEAGGVLQRLQMLPSATQSLPEAVAARDWLEPVLQRAQQNTSDSVRILRDDFVQRLESAYGETIDGVVTGREGGDYPRYYCLLKDRPLPQVTKRFSYVTGLPDAERIWPTKQLSFDPAEHRVGDSPQKRIAAVCKKIVERDAVSGTFAAEEMALDVLQACVAPPRDAVGDLPIDPCLHSLLLRFLLDRACKDSPALAEHFKKSLAIVNCGNTPDGTRIMIKGVDNEVFTAVLDPAKQDSDVWVKAQRAKCADFVKLVAKDVRAADERIAAAKKELKDKYEALRGFRCVGRLMKLPGGGWAIGGGDAVLRAGKQLFKAGDARSNGTMVSCVTCDAAGAIPAGTDVRARAGEPVYIEIRKARKG